MPRPCLDRHEMRPESCLLCWHAAFSPGYQQKWGLMPTGTPPTVPKPVGANTPTPAATPARPDCVELGEPLRNDQLIALGIDPAKCGCGGKVRTCAVHGRCTTQAPREGMACCATCPDYTSAASP